MNFNFNITRHEYDTKKHDKGINRDLLRNLATDGIEVDICDGHEMYNKANEMMNKTNLDHIICSMKKVIISL